MSRPILAVIAALLSLPFAVNAQSLTHLGQPQAEHVTLDYEFDPNNLCANSAIFVRRFANGTEAPNRFRVPNGKILIITDLIWDVQPGPSVLNTFVAGRTLNVQISSRTSSGQDNRVAFRSSPINLTEALAGPNRVGGSTHIIAGVRVGSGRVLCATAASISPGASTVHLVRSAEIHGYLVNRK